MQINIVEKPYLIAFCCRDGFSPQIFQIFSTVSVITSLVGPHPQMAMLWYVELEGYARGRL